jgi:hypothetical protein
MPRLAPQTRLCEHCGTFGAVALVLTCVRHVYAYRWLCARCRAVVTETPA